MSVWFFSCCLYRIFFLGSLFLFVRFCLPFLFVCLLISLFVYFLYVLVSNFSKFLFWRHVLAAGEGCSFPQADSPPSCSCGEVMLLSWGHLKSYSLPVEFWGLSLSFEARWTSWPTALVTLDQSGCVHSQSENARVLMPLWCQQGKYKRKKKRK